MADLKVSQLPVVSSVGATDKIIINTGSPQETSTITVANFQSQSGFAPIHINIPGNYTTPEISSVTGSGGDPQYINVFESTPSYPVTMPEGADKAVVIYNGKVSLLSRAGINATSGYVNYILKINQAGGEIAGQTDKNHINMSGGLHYNHASTSYSGDQVGKFTQTVTPVKSVILSFANKAVINFTPKCEIVKVKQGFVNILPGRLTILPYSSANPRTADVSVFADIDDEFIYPPLTDAEIESTTSDDLKERMLFVIQAVDDTLRYDAGFDAQFPSATTDTGFSGGTGLNGNMTPRELLQYCAEEVMAVKRGQASPNTTEQRLEAIVQLATPYVAFKFDWQVNSFASFF